MSETYEQIAEEFQMAPRMRERFLTYMRRRWPDTETQKCLDRYAAEWAMRFQNGDEFARSDGEGRLILLQIDSEP